MEWTNVLTEIFEVCVILLIGVVSAFVIKFLQAKKAELEQKADSQLSAKYLMMLTDTVTDCVAATNQTYVDSLKEQGKFDGAAQKEALKKTATNVLKLLSTDAKQYLTSAYGDLSGYITQKIEAEIHETKV